MTKICFLLIPHVVNEDYTRMKQINTLALRKLLKLYQHDTSIKNKIKLLDKIQGTDEHLKLIELYQASIPLIEHHIWKNGITEKTILSYQKIFNELEHIINIDNDQDLRHHFTIAIPVADRPKHLESCLQSILNLCIKFKYGGMSNGFYKKVNVIIADDSEQKQNIKKNRALATYFTQQGLKVDYFGSREQIDLIKKLKDKNHVENIIGKISLDKFFHKGASITRNITYLKLKQLDNGNVPTLFYFIDSDQEFQILTPGKISDEEYYAINYFYYLDRLFSTRNISILTGKVVGDPPVSPSVMAGNFLDDLISFVSEIANMLPEQSCQFHKKPIVNADDAAYHDMAELFGFKPTAESFNYHCSIIEKHDHKKCFSDVSRKLNQFFDGEHPTRKSYYKHENILKSAKPARTIYTGNYIFKSENLKYFIPFANLKFRMAGPVLGRIIKSDLKKKFVSANLPMLHKRTEKSIGQSEFRAGVNHKQNRIDLSDEFIRQFFGDVMLFSIIKLTELGFPGKKSTLNNLPGIISKTIKSMHDKYINKHKEISRKVILLKSIINSPQHWWNNTPDTNLDCQRFIQFIDNIEYNFGEGAPIYKTLKSEEQVEAYHAQILEAITDYSSDMSTWASIINTENNL